MSVTISLPNLSLSFDSSSLANLEGEISSNEEAFLKFLISALKDNKKDICKIAAKLVTPEMLSDSRIREIYEVILQEPNLDIIPVKLNGSKSVFTNILQKISSEKPVVDRNILYAVVEQLREVYIKKQAVKKLQHLDKCSTLDRVISIIDSLKDEVSKTFTSDESIHPILIGALEPEDLEQEIKWLIPEILFPQSVNIFFGPPSHGKSFLAFAIGVELLRKNLIDHFVYIDGDNPLVILQHRKINKMLRLFNKNKKKIIYQNLGSADAMQRHLESLINFPGNNLIVIDSLKDLAGNLNLNDQRDSTYIQTLIQKVRNGSKAINQNTILILHHENKAKEAKGNGVFLDGADCAYQFAYIMPKKNALTIKVQNKKSRIPVKDTVIFKVYTENYYLTEIVPSSSKTEKITIKSQDKAIVHAIQTYLYEKHKIGIKYIPIKEISENLQITERKLKRILMEYGHLWSIDNNNVALINKTSEVEKNLWTGEPINSEVFKKLNSIF